VKTERQDKSATQVTPKPDVNLFKLLALFLDFESFPAGGKHIVPRFVAHANDVNN
jgi:hypothetical protein